MELPRPPSAVTFDCWSTLIQDISWDATVARRRDLLIEIAEALRISLDPERAMELIEGSWQEHVVYWRKGEVFGPQGTALWVREQVGLEVEPDSADKFVEDLADALGGATRGVGTLVVEGAPQAVEKIRGAGIKTALICDTGFTPGSHVRTFLEEHGIEVDHYFFSDEVGKPKPHPQIFEAALKATGAPANETIHIGDLRRTDVAGARAIGMATIRFTGVHDDGWNPEESRGPEADAVLARWDDIHELIGI